jgi:hypothetical protein
MARPASDGSNDIFWITAGLQFVLDVGLSSCNHGNCYRQQLANFHESKAVQQAIRLDCNGALDPKVSSGLKTAVAYTEQDQTVTNFSSVERCHVTNLII